MLGVGEIKQMNSIKYGVADKPPIKELIPLSFQMLLSCFGATILVPMLTGLSIGPALFGAGIGTLIFVLLAKKKVGLFLGSSFAFIAPIIFAGQYGPGYIAGGCIVSGLLYMIVADRKSTRLNSSHIATSRMPSSA